MKKVFVYQVIIFILTLVLFVFMMWSHENYVDLLETMDKKTELIEQQKSNYEKMNNEWEKRYEQLEVDYGKLIVQKGELKAEYENYKKRTKIPTYKFTREEIYLIAQCVEAEAGYYQNAPNSQRYVTQVILNRLKSGKFPNTVKDVIYQKNQFSVAHNGMMKNRVVQKDTLNNVYSVIVHGTNLPSYVLYFYSASVKENWVNTLNTYTKCEGTIFAYQNKE